MRRRSFAAAAVAAGLALLGPATEARAFCGFYVAKADASLFNKASQVILARDGTRTTITMQNDYRGDPAEFALVVPVPVVLQDGDVKVVEPRIFERLDAFSTPRLVEYHDPDPCRPPSVRVFELSNRLSLGNESALVSASPRRDAALGVKVERSFSVGEYDIQILSARQSDGLETWLGENGYRLPKGAAAALRPYVAQDMKFFVAKVKVAAGGDGVRVLRPLQFSYDSPRFMLPMRLGMLNADGPQDLIVFALSREGRVEATNYRTVRIATDVELPVELKDPTLFAGFYRRLFDRATRGEGFRAVFTEFAWDMSWCDPCAGDPLTSDELIAAGATWVTPAARPSLAPGRRLVPLAGAGGAAIVTRLHVRYTPQSFPEDLVFHETGDRQPFQARYILRHAYPTAPDACPQAAAYVASVWDRQREERATLQKLTSFSLDALVRDAVAK